MHSFPNVSGGADITISWFRRCPFLRELTECVFLSLNRVLLERLIVNRPHPWGLLITFIELIKNHQYKFWSHEFVHCAPEIEKYIFILCVLSLVITGDGNITTNKNLQRNNENYKYKHKNRNVFIVLSNCVLKSLFRVLSYADACVASENEALKCPFSR